MRVACVEMSVTTPVTDPGAPARPDGQPASQPPIDSTTVTDVTADPAMETRATDTPVAPADAPPDAGDTRPEVGDIPPQPAAVIAPSPTAAVPEGVSDPDHVVVIKDVVMKFA